MHGLELPDPGEPRFCGRCAHKLVPTSLGGRFRPRCPECGWTYYAKPALGAGVLVVERNRVLLVRRAHDPYRDWWTLPTGYVEYGEDAAETAAREALEETGLLVEVDGCHGVFFGGGDPRGAAHLAVFHARALGGQVRAGDDAAEARWFPRGALPDAIAFEAHRKALARWATGRRRGVEQPALLFYGGTGPAPPLVVYAVIENPRGSIERMRYDDGRGRFVPTGEAFAEPLRVHYGWIPRTFSAPDQRELDAIVVGEGVAAVGSVVACRPIGALLKSDEDHKIVAVRVDLPSAYAVVTEIDEVADLREEIERLFVNRAPIRGWATAAEARRLVLESQRLWVSLRSNEE